MRCKVCRDKFEPKYFLQKVCLEPSCILEWNKKVKDKEWKAEKKVLKDKLKTYSDHVKELQIIFNKFIRARDNGLPCISCSNPNMKKVNASHYYNANNHYSVRFNEDNVHSACEYCNTYLSGNLIPYREALIKKIGIERFKYLELIANDTVKYSIPELIEMKVIYKDKIKQL
jgi:hypothetical protein